MTGFVRNAIVAGMAVAMTAAFQLETAAQGSFLGGIGKIGGRKSSTQSFTANATSMDMDLAANIVSLVGSVEVDNPDINIKCHKMIIYLEDAKPADGKKKVKMEDEDDPTKSKQVSKIEWIGDVVFTRKPKTIAGDNAPQAEQKALAGRANFNVIEEKIVFLEDPVLIQDKNRISAGNAITYDIKSDRATFQGGVHVETSQSAPDEAAPAKPAEKTEKP